MSLIAGYELKEFDAASLTGAFQNMGSALSNAAYYAIIFNDSDVDVYISTDGTTNNFRIPAGFSFPISSYPRHNTLNQGSYIFKSGTQLQIKQVTAAGTGNIIINILTTK